MKKTCIIELVVKHDSPPFHFYVSICIPCDLNALLFLQDALESVGAVNSTL